LDVGALVGDHRHGGTADVAGSETTDFHGGRGREKVD
jgi:hypothetical protein